MWRIFFVILLFIILSFLYYGEDTSKYKQETDEFITWKFDQDIGSNETVELALNIIKSTGVIERLEFGYEANDTIRSFKLQRTTSGDIRLFCFDMRDRPDQNTRNRIIYCIREWMSKITPKNEDLIQFQQRLEEEI